MAEFTEKILLPEIPDLNKIEVYEQRNGYSAFKKALAMEPDDIIAEVKKSGLRGRGGAAFPTGLKWSFIPKGNDKPKYLCANGDEGEPGTFKDRQIFEYNPHLFIEGCLIASFAMGIKITYVYIRGEYKKWIDILQTAIDEAYTKNYIGENILGTSFSTDIYIYRGAGAYICGEESSLMNSIEGERGYARVRPPFPAQVGLWGNPTNVNNIETLSCVPSIIQNGGEWFSKIGAPTHPGTILFGISGHVKKPGVYELPTGVLLTDLIHNYAGGVRENKKIKAVIPGGSSVPWLLGDELEGVRMDLDSLKAAGSAIGTGGVIVMDEDTDVLKVLKRISHFYHHESCGQCTPCREGTGWMEKILDRFIRGEGTMSDIELLLDVANNIEGNTICALGDAAAWPVQSVIKKFRSEFEKRVRKSPIEKIVVRHPHYVSQ
ncbi:MAG: NADH-quinone oxidoreductase subunit NuoF [Bacteroidetes bacterium]|nr:NADH-quinone oxidoreductase subunit NuoF [Bacteroidota bacterium]MBU1422427.1 NADH-quinone oxidoreductase subunit NuoF [Bacteroidota bacterium]MBU2471186.1 NADH-quinone oxidoreductase subunit NuoF [Bacteroidota bacterium]